PRLDGTLVHTRGGIPDEDRIVAAAVVAQRVPVAGGVLTDEAQEDGARGLVLHLQSRDAADGDGAPVRRPDVVLEHVARVDPELAVRAPGEPTVHEVDERR